jgi:hypothetical protein
VITEHFSLFAQQFGEHSHLQVFIGMQWHLGTINKCVFLS